MAAYDVGLDPRQTRGEFEVPAYTDHVGDRVL